MNDLQRYLVYEFVEDYKDGYLSRREMMRKVLYITGGIASTAALLLTLGCGGSSGPSATATTSGSAASPTGTSPASPPRAATSAAAASPPVAGSPSSGTPSPAGSPPATRAASPSTSEPPARSSVAVAANDPAIEGQDISFAGNGTTLLAYQARPRQGSGPLPLVLVCHENRGLTEHIRDVTRRFAKEGYLACAVDLLSREGGTTKVADPAQIPALLSGADPSRHVGDFAAAIAYYQGQPNLVDANRVGLTGYCFGGGIVWRAATQIAALKVAVPFYGPPPPLDQVPNIKAAVFGVYSSDPNDFANNGRDQLEAALKAANVTYEVKVYPNTQHAFHNDTGPRWNEEQALTAWRDTLAWFGRYLGG